MDMKNPYTDFTQYRDFHHGYKVGLSRPILQNSAFLP